MKILCAGSGGFIGGHLVKRLLKEGHQVRAVDLKPLKFWHQVHPAAENFQCLDLQTPQACRIAVRGVDQIYHLAADMGGMGFIQTHQADCMFSALITGHLLQAARAAQVERFFYASSACVYAADKQRRSGGRPLKEADAWPAEPERGYGMEKLFGEQLCELVSQDYGLLTRVARYHNIYGPWGTFSGGREKAPAALCRKAAVAKRSGRHQIEIWGDGEQTRSFTYIDDGIEGTRRLMDSAYGMPLNIGSSELVTINQLVTIVEEIAQVRLERRYLRDAPQGVRGRNSDNNLVQAVLGWEPSLPLQLGIERTYRWIWDATA